MILESKCNQNCYLNDLKKVSLLMIAIKVACHETRRSHPWYRCKSAIFIQYEKISSLKSIWQMYFFNLEKNISIKYDNQKILKTLEEIGSRFGDYS